MTFNSEYIHSVLDFVRGKTFDEVKEYCEKNNIRVRELNTEESTKNLYLLVLDEDKLVHNTDHVKQLKEKIDLHQEQLNKYKEQADFENYKLLLNALKTERQNLANYLNEKKTLNKNELTDFQLMLNGPILEKDTNKLVCMCYKRMRDNVSIQNTMYKDIKVEYCEDGTIMRLYNYNGMWLTATRRCIDAKYSYWSGLKNFDEMFWEVIKDKDIFLSKLDVNMTYFFVLKHIDNRIVIKNDHSNLIYLGGINNTTYEESSDLKLTFPELETTTSIDINTDGPVEIEDLKKKAANSNKRGLIVTTTTGEKYKYDFDHFTYLKELRGNTPLIRMRILELLSNKQMLDKFMENYNEYNMSYSMVMMQLQTLSRYIHKLYIDTHVKKRMILDKDNIYFKFLKQLHNQFKETHYPILQKDVECLLEKTKPLYLKTLLGWTN